MTGSDEMRQKQDKPTLDLKKSEDRKKVAELLVSGYSQKDIGVHFGYSPSTISMILLRAGGTDQFIEETMGRDAVKQYRAHLSDQHREISRAGGRTRHEKDLIADVAEDQSMRSRGGRLDDLGTPEHTTFRQRYSPGLNMSRLPSHIEKTKKRLLRIFELAAKAGKHKEEVAGKIESLIQSIHDKSPTASNVPVLVSSYKGTQDVLVLRVKRLTKTEASEAGDEGQVIDEFIGVLNREIREATEPSSKLGQTLRANGYQKVELQTVIAGQPMELNSKQF